MNNYSLASIGDILGYRFLYNTVVLPDFFDLGRHLAWLCRSQPDFGDDSLCVKAYKNGRLVMRKALRF